MSKESKEAKKAAKAEKKANKQPKNPEVTKSVISSVTAILCVIAIVLTSVSITNKICANNIEIAEKYPAASGGNGGSAAVSTDTGDTAADVGYGDEAQKDDAAPVDDGTVVDDAAPVDDGTVVDDATPADTSASDSSSSTPANNGGSSSSNTPAPTKAAAPTSSAPVGSDIAKIVAYYNTAANKTKAYTGTIKFTVTEGTNTKITETSFPSVAKNIANGMLPNDYPKKEVGTISNGHVKGTRTYKDGETKPVDKSFKDWIVCYGDAKMSKLTPAGVKSASCVKTAGGYKITMKLKPETVSGLSARPTSHFACMQVMELTDDDLKPFTVQDCKVNYTGGTLTAVVNESNGMLNAYGYVNPIHLTGTLKWSAVKGTAVVDSTTQGSYTFTY